MNGSQFFEDIETNADVTKLHKEIRRVSHQMEIHISIYDIINKANIRYYEYNQGDDESNTHYLKTSKT